MNPTTDAGATEFLANLSVGTVVGVAVILTCLRLLLLTASGGIRPGGNAEGSFGRAIAEIFESLIIAGVLVFLIIRPFFVQAFFIPSESMENTLMGHDQVNVKTGARRDDTIHDHIFVNKLIYRIGEPQRGDIIVFKAPKVADQEDANNNLPQQENVLIKRLIGVPGDTIEVKDGAVYRNGERLDELNNPKLPYSIKEPMNQSYELNFKYGTPNTTGPLKLPPGQLWVMGDNRNDSNDSRYWGTLDRSRVMGKANLIFWPLNRVRILH